MQDLPTPSYKIGNPSKMPGFSFGLPAQLCITGRKLAALPDTVCSGCYALKGNYRFRNVKEPRFANHRWLMHCLASGQGETWINGMVEAIGNRVTVSTPFFRWHDSGDLQSAEHLLLIMKVCERLPSVQFWLPTREYAMVQDVMMDGHAIPSNLTIRLSAHKLNTTIAPSNGLVASSVDAGVGFICPARTQGNECRECRACWSLGVANVDYVKH